MIQSIGDFVENSMTIFGDDVNKRRQLPLIHDGLKPSYRRLIYSTLNMGEGYTKVATIIGDTLGHYHPHGDASLEQPISNMVRWGIFEGHGNHGAKTLIGPDIEKSAPRYIGARLASQYRKFFSELMPYVPYDEAEIEGNVEPRYLPTPYPICLTHGTLGIGQGVNCRIPAFTLKSIHNAYIHNDPQLLEAPFGLKLDKENSELDEIWNTGLGRLTYSFDVYADWSDAGYGIFIKGESELFKPLMTEIDQQVEWSRCYIIDMTSDDNGGLIFIGRNKSIRAVSYEDILAMAKKASTHSKTFRLTVADENNFYLIPLKDWLDFTYKNYLELVEKYKQDKINKLNFEYLVYKWLPIVTEILINNRDFSTEDIVNQINDTECSIEVASAILRKSISTLRNTDSANKLKSIEASIKEFESLDAVKKIQSIIDSF